MSRKAMPPMPRKARALTSRKAPPPMHRQHPVR